MTCILKQGDEAFSLPNCLHEQMVLAWLVSPDITTTDDESSCMLQHLCQKYALFRSAICLNMLAVVEGNNSYLQNQDEVRENKNILITALRTLKL